MFLVRRQLQILQKNCPGEGPGFCSIPALINRIWTRQAGVCWSTVKKVGHNGMMGILGSPLVEERLEDFVSACAE